VLPKSAPGKAHDDIVDYIHTTAHFDAANRIRTVLDRAGRHYKV
jgi:hypothetical protein